MVYGKSSLKKQSKTDNVTYPKEHWEWAKPEKMGFSSSKLKKFTEYLDSLPTSHMFVAIHGRVIFTYGDVSSTEHVIASCRKSVLSMLYGKYVDNGTINLDTTLEELGIDDIGGLLPIEKKATIRHLLTATSGCYHTASNTGDDRKYAPKRGSVEPGTYFLYNNWDFNAAGYVFELLTKKNIYESFEQDLAIPLQLEDFNRSIHRKSGNLSISRFPAYHFRLSVRDMARLAYLMLRHGKWADKQILSPEWVKLSTTTVTPREKMNPPKRHKSSMEYAYLWWPYCPRSQSIDQKIFRNAYTACGMGGQRITVLPELDMVIAHKVDKGKIGTSTYNKIIERFNHCRK